MKKFTTGFTIVETLVAISILTLSIVATFTATQTGIRTSTIAKDQITAFYLTQEGMEFIRNIRDENTLHSMDSIAHGGPAISWLHGLAENGGDPCYFGKTCIIDSPYKVVLACSGGFGTCPNIQQDTVSGLMSYTTTCPTCSAWPATNFKREIQLQSVSANEILVIISETWVTRGMTLSFQVTESLLNHG